VARSDRPSSEPTDDARFEAVRDVLSAMSRAPFDVDGLLNTMCEHAVVISGRTYSRVEGDVEAEPLGASDLKGFRRPVEAYLVTRMTVAARVAAS
jgi:hypothetical protein